MIPLRTGTEVVNKVIRGLVAGRRICRVLSVEAGAGRRRLPEAGGGGLGPCRRTLRTARAARTAHSRGLGGTGGVRRAGGPDRALRRRPRVAGRSVAVELERGFVRRAILVSDANATLFSGRLRDELDVRGDSSDEDILAAVATASAEDVLETLDAGLDSEVEERGRSFSGGQRQRLVLVRALASIRTCWCSSSRPPPWTPTPRPASPSGSPSTGPGGRPSSRPPARCCWTGPTRWR